MDDVILLSRLQSEKMHINVDNCLPKDIVSYVYHILNAKDRKEGIVIKIVIPLQFQDVVIQADEKMIRQVLTNLLSNALKYTIQGEIEMGYLVQKETIEFYVKDSGIGIPLTEQAKIFDTFYRGEEARSLAIRGNGLGLNISKELVELMGGTISVDSVHKKGSRFYFSVPILTSKPSELVS
jgi:signal transduction histidine kinase